ncbi:hypothetical protein AZH43_16795 [Acinetobacter pragensis]|uniref:Uncharacterized protein n=1 Tax=Acinetobacter pragensis TaxID=1806892 RepID=A0A151XZ99_9GAMM|nr:hypothetical protein AZH43_16795 [Acinetobacter pragensis]
MDLKALLYPINMSDSQFHFKNKKQVLLGQNPNFKLNCKLSDSRNFLWNKTVSVQTADRIFQCIFCKNRNGILHKKSTGFAQCFNFAFNKESDYLYTVLNC